MYQDFYGLRELPFELTPDPRYVFLTARHREALSNLEYGLSVGKSLTLLIGEAGTGKTTLLHAALQSERCRNVICVYLNNPALNRDEFVHTVAARFQLSSAAMGSKAVLLEELERVLRERRAAGTFHALVVDEAQRLSHELLEEVRLLGNMETSTQKLLPLVLAGQPELATRLEQPDLAQLKQRVSLRCEIAPLTLSEAAAYIASRISRAGGAPPRLFTQEAVRLIHEYSSGIPRTISVMCDNALVNGMVLNRQPVDRAVILEVCRDFALHRSGEPGRQGRIQASAESGAAVPPSGEGRLRAGDERGNAPRPALFADVSRGRRLSLFVRRSRSDASSEQKKGRT